MTRGSVSRRTTGATNATPALEIISAPSVAGIKGLWLRELVLTLVAATASVYGCGRPAAKGVTPTSPLLFPLELSGDPTTMRASTALAWVTPPTIPSAFYRQASLPATIGASVHWTFYNLWIPAGFTFVVWNGAAAPNSVADVDVIVDEEA